MLVPCVRRRSAPESRLDASGRGEACPGAQRDACGRCRRLGRHCGQLASKVRPGRDVLLVLQVRLMLCCPGPWRGGRAPARGVVAVTCFFFDFLLENAGKTRDRNTNTTTHRPVAMPASEVCSTRSRLFATDSQANRHAQLFSRAVNKKQKVKGSGQRSQGKGEKRPPAGCYLIMASPDTQSPTVDLPTPKASAMARTE